MTIIDDAAACLGMKKFAVLISAIVYKQAANNE